MTTIIEALSKVSADIGAVRKRERNQQQGFNFRGIDSIINAAWPALRQHGVVFTPKVLAKEIRESTSARGGKVSNVYLTVRYRFYGPEGDHLDATVAAESFDWGDKATAKAMSVALRTALLQVLALPTDEPDPDTHSYQRADEPVGASDAVAKFRLETATLDELREAWPTADNATKKLIEVRVAELKQAGDAQ